MLNLRRHKTSTSRASGVKTALVSVCAVSAFAVTLLFVAGTITGRTIPQESHVRIDTRESLRVLKLSDQHIKDARYKDAEIVLRSLILKEPANASAHNSLGFVLKKQGRTKKAIETYEQAIALRPAYFEARNNLAMALESAQRFKEAEGVYLRALTDAPAEPTLRLNYAMLLEAEDRADEAVAQFYTFLATSQNTELKALVRERIEALR